MRTLFRITMTLVGLGVAVSTSQAFWRHKSASYAEAPGASCASGSCAPGASCAPGITYVPETREVCVTRMVPQTTMQKVTVMVPMRVAPVAAPAAPAGCYGSAPKVGAGCYGSAGAGCYGSSNVGAGCYGSRPQAQWENVGASLSGSGSDTLSPRLAQMESKLTALEAKMSTLTTIVTDIQTSSKAQDKTALPIPVVPVPAQPTGAAKPISADGAAPAADPLLAAARAFKAKQALTKDASPPPTGELLATGK